MRETLFGRKFMLLIGAKLTSTKSMTTEEYRRRPRDVEYQNGGWQVQTSDLWCAWQVIDKGLRKSAEKLSSGVAGRYSMTLYKISAKFIVQSFIVSVQKAVIIHI